MAGGSQVTYQPVELDAEYEDQLDLVSLLNGRMAEAVANIPDKYRHMSEVELINEVDPNITEYTLRNRFHQLVETARKTGGKITTTSIIDGIISKPTFWNLYLPRPEKIAFITRPVIHHNQMNDAIYRCGLKKIFDFVRTHPLDAKTAAVFARIVEKAGDRVIGPVVQRMAIHQKTETLSSSSERSVDANPDDPKAMLAKIDEMQARVTAMTNKQLVEKVIDVEPEE